MKRLFVSFAVVVIIFASMHIAGAKENEQERVDISTIRRIKLVDTLITDEKGYPNPPMRMGNLDVLSPIVGKDSVILKLLGASISEVEVT